MNCIILEGVVLYIFIAIVIALMLISLGCICYAILYDRRESVLINMLSIEKEKVRKLTKQNFILKIKSGEFDINEM